MECSSGLPAAYSYSASTYFNFLAPRRGATAGPFFLPARPAAVDGAAEDVVELEYVDSGRVAAGMEGVVNSTYVEGTMPSL